MTITIDKHQLRKIIAEQLDIPDADVKNPALLIPIGNKVSFFSDAIERGETLGMHVLYCKHYEKVENNWMYELENAEIFYLEPVFFQTVIKIYKETNTPLAGKIQLDLTPSLGLPTNKVFRHPEVYAQNKPLVAESASTNTTVDKPVEIIVKNITLSPDMDRDASKVSKREYIAVLLKVPYSGMPWIDEMIQEALRIKRINH